VAYIGGISTGFKVEVESLRAAMKKMDDDLADLTAINREAAQDVSDERKARVPYQTGHFAKAAYVRASARQAYVGLRNTGRGSNDYIGVQEFGGTIARYHSEHRTHVKPWVGGGSGSSYYLYPALGAQREAITEKYREHVAVLAAKYMP
jgi:hypothetical protein